MKHQGSVTVAIMALVGLIIMGLVYFGYRASRRLVPNQTQPTSTVLQNEDVKPEKLDSDLDQLDQGLNNVDTGINDKSLDLNQ